VPPDIPTSLLFIDGTNLDRRISEGIGERDVDYAKLFDSLSAGTRRLGVIYCTADYARAQGPGRDDRRAKQKRTYNRLSAIADVKIFKGRHVQREDYCGRCRYRFPGFREKGTDVLVSSHLVRAAYTGKAERLILVANDNDYLPALEIVAEIGVPVILAYVAAEHSDHRAVLNMRNAAAGRIVIDGGLLDGMWIEKPTADSPQKQK
jgi:uncharacterized LabA/DUF88 family protein